MIDNIYTLLFYHKNRGCAYTILNQNGYLLLTKRKGLVFGAYIFSKNQNAMSKNKHPHGLLGKRSKPPALFIAINQM